MQPNKKIESEDMNETVLNLSINTADALGDALHELDEATHAMMLATSKYINAVIDDALAVRMANMSVMFAETRSAIVMARRDMIMKFNNRPKPEPASSEYAPSPEETLANFGIVGGIAS